jgi:regulator of replication initiation timing
VTVTEIESEAKKWQAKVIELEAARKEVEAAKRQAEEERRRHLLAAAEGDPEAVRVVGDIRRRLAELTSREEELAATLEAVREKLAELEAARREAARRQLMNQLAGKAKERLELAREVERHVDGLAEVLKTYFKVCREGYSITHKVMPGADGFWLTKDRVFGFLCWRLKEYFPSDLPPPLATDCEPFVAREERALAQFMKGGDDGEDAS